MDDDPKRSSAPPPAERDGTESAKGNRPTVGDRRVIRAADLTDEDIASIETSEMAPGYEHLDVELDEG